MKAPSILLVEDNPATRRLVRRALERRGYVVVEAPDGKTALRLAQQSKPQLVLQDLILPDIDGFALAAELRTAVGGDVPFVAFSGYIANLDDSRLAAAGFDDVVAKPVAPSRLLAIVEAHLPLADSAAETVGAGRRVLVVDDDPSRLRWTSLRLARVGFDVQPAADAAAALALARDVVPAAVVAEAQMSDLDGIALAIAMRKDGNLARVPLILLTSNEPSSQQRTVCLRAGATDLVPRAPDPIGLVAALAAALDAVEPAGPPTLDSLPVLEAERATAVLEQLERQVALNAGLAQRCSVLSAELSVLHAISDAMVKHTSIEDALEEAVASCFDASGISVGALYSLDGGALRGRSLGGTATLAAGALDTFFGHESMLDAIIAAGEVVTLPSPAWAEGSKAVLDGCAAASAMVVPLAHLGRPLGALLMVGRGSDLAHGDWLAFIRGVSPPIAQALALAGAAQERRRAEQAALDSRAEWQALADHVPDIVIKLDRSGRIAYVNRSIMGVAPADAIGRDWSELAQADQRAAMRRHLEHVLTVGEPVTYEIVWHDEGCAPVWYSSHLGPVRRDGELVGAVALWRDITQRKQTDAQLIVSDRMVSIGTLAAGVAHEINNPLAAVIANLDLAQREAAELGRRADASELHDIVCDARDAAERVRVIVRDLKLFSRASDDESRAPVDIHAALESTLRMAWNEIRHRARLVKSFADVPQVSANESRLGQVFLNLLVNAAQAIPEGHAESNEIRVVTRRDGADRVAVAISDTGVGMPVEVQRRLFTPFFTTKPIGVGTGLGLPICQRIVASLGGTITVTSEVGKGSTFVVSLPVAPPVDPLTPRPPTRPPLGTRRGRVLVIDDERMVAAVVRRILAVAHDVTTLDHAGEALELLRAGGQFDVVLCDLMMPHMTGMDFYAELARSFPEMTDRVIFVTGGPFTTRARDFLDSVPNLRIEKPFDAKQLRQIVGVYMA